MMKTILVVDDEKDNLTILDIYLKQKGFVPLLCNSGTGAIEKAREQSPDLVILDIMMPEMDGFEVCRRLKADPRTRDIPVIFLTARFIDKKDLIEGLNIGGFDYITKPFDEGELFARINTALKIRDTEENLKQQRDYLKTILNSVGNDILIIKPDYTVDMANEVFLKSHGLSQDDVVGKYCHEISCLNNVDGSDNCPATSAFQGIPARQILERQDPAGGETRFMSVSAFPVFKESGQVERVVEIHQDITRDLRKEKEVRRVNIMLENILLRMNEGLIYLDQDMNVVIMNSKARKLLDSHGIIENGKAVSLGDLGFSEIMARHREQKDVETIFHTVSADDEYYKLNSTVVDVHETRGLIITIDNITQELRTQEELVQSAKLASIGELAASIAHEINNPITGIIGYTELLGMYSENLPKKAGEIIHKMNRECNRVRNIIENLLKFSRRQQVMDMSYVDISASLREVVFLVSASFKENNLTFNIQIPDDLPVVYCNSGLVQQAVLNLLQNAYDAILTSGKGTFVTLDVTVTDSVLTITVSDDGPGIPNHVKEKIFDPFFSTKSKGKGTGLGLSLVHRIVRVHKGVIQCDTSETGTIFTLKLPVTAPVMTAESPTVEERDKFTQVFKKAIVVDDDSAVREYLSDIMYTFKYKVDEAKDAREAAKLLRHNAYDIIIIDVKLPDRDGFDVYSDFVREFPDRAGSVIFITGDVSLDTRESLRKTGRTYLIKPFSFSDLISALNLK